MAKKKRNPSASSSDAVSSASISLKSGGASAPGGFGAAPVQAWAAKPVKPTAAATINIPSEVTKGDWTIVIFALMLFLTPALGVPNELMLQDTLKSIVAAFATLGAALWFFWGQRSKSGALRWHWMTLLPVLLMAYALGSMAWSHTFLAGVEAIRWFLLAVIVFLMLQTANRERLPLLVLAIHAGAVAASLWGATQFWFDMRYIPQGPNPASTFVNRNFAAEYVAMCIPFSAWIVLRSKSLPGIGFAAFTAAFNLVFIFMTGTRSALLSLIITAVFIPVAAYLYRDQLQFKQWDSARRVVAIGVSIATVLVLGLIKTGNVNIEKEERGNSALERAAFRYISATQVEEYTERSFSVRLVMWKATGRMIAARPLSGVGAGAWEVDLPLYQAPGSALETDYYVHNEILQLLAEYGVTGWVFLIVLLAYLAWSVWRTLRARTPEACADAPWRAVALTCITVFLFVSNAGFPWRLASTAVLFAVCFGFLLASDARQGWGGFFGARRLAWSAGGHQAAAVTSIVCLALAGHISLRAAESERLIVSATRIALSISNSPNPRDPRHLPKKQEMLKLIKEGTDINPHYRKITPMVADELAKWGDWPNAIWVWESVVSSRPYVVAIMGNIARGYHAVGQTEKSREWLNRALKVQPTAATLTSMDMMLLVKEGKNEAARTLAKRIFETGNYDQDMLNYAPAAAVAMKDWDWAIEVLVRRGIELPGLRSDSLMRIANIFQVGAAKNDLGNAARVYKMVYEETPDALKAEQATRIPTYFHEFLGIAGAPKPVPPVPAAKGTPFVMPPAKAKGK